MNSNNILWRVGESDIFSLGTEKGDDELFLWAPRDSANANKESEPRNGVAMNLQVPICIWAPCNVGLSTTKDKFELPGSREVTENSSDRLDMGRMRWVKVLGERRNCKSNVWACHNRGIPLQLQTIKAIVNRRRFKGSSSDEPRRVQVLDLYCLTRFESESSGREDVY